MRVFEGWSHEQRIVRSHLHNLTHSLKDFRAKERLRAVYGKQTTMTTDVNRKWTFCIIGEWFGWNSRVNRLHKRKEILQYKFVSVKEYKKGEGLTSIFFSHFQSTCVAQKRLCLSSNTRLNAVPVRETFKWSELLLSSPFKGKKFGLRCLALPCNCFSFLQPILQGARASTAFARSTIGGVVGGDGEEFFAYWTQSSGRSANSSIRELKHRRRRSQRERQKSNRFRLAKQQLCTWITLFSTFLCRIKQHRG